jgi:SAM-dependent methyltransferase
MKSGAAGLLGDTTARDYSRKLRLFNSFAKLELKRAIAGLALREGMHVLDAGCGTGEALTWLSEELGEGRVVGVDLASAHVRLARESAPPDVLVAQADLRELPFRDGSFDLIWSVNTINHLRDPVNAVERLAKLLRPAGVLALGQSSFVPDMYFAWDSRLERVTTEAVRQYYRDRYQLDERDLTGVRGLVGLVRRAGLKEVHASTTMIERVSPLSAEDQAYLWEAIFRDTWGERLRPYLSGDDFKELSRLCDPADPAFALSRTDFHFLQSFTLISGRRLEPGARV